MEKYGRDYVDLASNDEGVEAGRKTATLKKWLVNVQCNYRSAPDGEIVPDANWPRNGETLEGYEILDTPGIH